jgi:hypothetical protein
MTADTEREVIIVQNADVFPVEKEDVLDRREGKREVPADADITGLSRIGDAVRIGDALGDRRPVLCSQRCLARQV